MVIRGLFALLCCLLASPAWAFPDNGILDSFTGCVDTTTPPNSNWTNAVFFGASSSTVDCEDLAVTSTTTNGEGDMYWNPTSFNAACEAYATIVDVGSTNSGIVYCRLQNIGANTTDGYAVYWIDASATISIARLDNGVHTLLGTNITQTITTTDKFGIKTVGDQICAWYSDSGGAWTELGCRTDATYLTGGRIGLSVNGNTGIGEMDDFGGGNVAEIASVPTRRRAF